MSHDRGTGYSPNSNRRLARMIANINFIQSTAQKKRSKQNSSDSNENALARYTRGLFIATCVIAGAAVLTFFAALLQWDALKNTDSATRELTGAVSQQVKEAHEQVAAIKQQLDFMEIDQRPWIRSDVEIASDLTFREEEARITLKHKVKNTGRSPAFNFNAWSKIVRKTNIYDMVDDMLKNYCSELDDLAKESGLLAFGNILFPGDSDEIDEPIGIDIPKPIKREPSPPVVINPTQPDIPGFSNIPNWYNPYVVNPNIVNPNIADPYINSSLAMLNRPILLSCVHYESRIGLKRAHHSGESLYLATAFPGEPRAWGEPNLIAREVIPKERLQLFRHPFEWRKYGD